METMLLEEWITTISMIIISAIVGYAIPDIISIIKFIIGKPFRKEPIEGTWHTYHFTQRNKRIHLKYIGWTIKRNLLNVLKVNTYDPIHDLKYEGTISVERNYFLINMSGIKHKEKAQFRFYDFIPTGENIVFGLCLGIDYDTKLKSELWIMSRKKLSNDKAGEILRSNTRIIDNLIIGLREESNKDHK